MPLQGKNEVQHAAVERIHLAAVGIDVYGGDTGAVLMPQGGGYIIGGGGQLIEGEGSPGMSRPVGGKRGEGRIR